MVAPLVKKFVAQILVASASSRIQVTGFHFLGSKLQASVRTQKKSDSIIQNEDFTPRPRIPPGRLWYHPHREFTSSYDDSQIVQDQDLHQDHSCDADVHYDYGANDDDIFSDAAEVLSLTESEAIDIVEKAEKGHGLDGFNLESFGHDQSISPSYIIDRFLPDAAALAASSVF